MAPPMRRTPLNDTSLRKSPPATRSRKIIVENTGEAAGLPPINTTPLRPSLNTWTATGAIPKNIHTTHLSPAADGLPPYPGTPEGGTARVNQQGRIFPLHNQPLPNLHLPPEVSLPSREELHSFIQNAVQQNVRNALNHIESQSQYNRNNFVENVNPSMFGNFSNVPNFDDEGSIHPVDFIGQIQVFFQNNNLSFNNIKFNLAEKFQGRAKIWGNAFVTSFTDFNTFKNYFLDYFWDDTRQLNIKLKIESGIYERGSYVEHFLNYMGLARHIHPPFSDRSLINLISRHYPPHISTILIGVHTIAEAINRLKQADYVSRNDFKPLNNNNHKFPTNTNYYPNKKLPYNKSDYANRVHVSTIDFPDNSEDNCESGNA